MPYSVGFRESQLKKISDYIDNQRDKEKMKEHVRNY